MNSLIEKVRNEPVLATTMLAAVVALLVSFGIPVSDGQQAAIMGVAFAALAFVARSKVTPNNKLDQ